MAEEVKTLFTLLVVFQVKHFLADFPLQLPYMLRKVANGWAFFLPLLSHVAVHGTITFCILLYFRPEYWWLALADATAHFMMDRLKAGQRYLGRYNDSMRASFWIALGFDQMIHHLTHYILIYIIVFQ